jgi:hypothetical protein
MEQKFQGERRAEYNPSGGLQPDGKPAEDTGREDKSATVGMVQGIVNALLQSIRGAFALKSEVQAALASLTFAVNRLLQSDFATKAEAERIAENKVPRSLRELDGAQKQGNVLCLSAGGEYGQDTAYWGQLAPSSILPDGSESEPHLVWNVETEEWESDLIDLSSLIPGVEEGDVLVWNADTGEWEIISLEDFLQKLLAEAEEGDVLVYQSGKWVTYNFTSLLPHGTDEKPHLVWEGEWVIGKISGLPSGGEQYQVLQRDGSGGAVWDWTRWA